MTRMWESCTKMLVSVAVRMFFTFHCCCRTCFFLMFCSFDQVRPMFRQSLSCQLVAAAAAAAAAASEGCRRPTVLTPMLTESRNTPSVCLRATARHASSFNFLCFSFIKCKICFCCCCVCSFSCASVSFVAAVFYYFDDFLVSFFELGHFNTDAFSACVLLSCFFFHIFMIKILSRH